MFFFLSKTVGYLLLPSNLLIVAGLAALMLFVFRRRRAAARLAVAAFTVLLVICFMPIGDFLTNTLENRFPRWETSRGAPDGVIVLGGSLDPGISANRGVPIVNQDSGRIVAIANLAQLFPNARIIFSGGSGSLDHGAPAEADFVYPLLDELNVPRSRVELENRSRNTVENAVFSKAIARPRPGERWLLVTSAWHMPRAIGCFRAAGFPVEAYPVDWQTVRRIGFQLSSSPTRSLMRTDNAVHEFTGLLAYWVTGRTSALFPAP